MREYVCVCVEFACVRVRFVCGEGFFRRFVRVLTVCRDKVVLSIDREDTVGCRLKIEEGNGRTGCR